MVSLQTSPDKKLSKLVKLFEPHFCVFTQFTWHNHQNRLWKLQYLNNGSCYSAQVCFLHMLQQCGLLSPSCIVYRTQALMLQQSVGSNPSHDTFPLEWALNHICILKSWEGSEFFCTSQAPSGLMPTSLQTIKGVNLFHFSPKNRRQRIATDLSGKQIVTLIPTLHKQD